MSHQLSEVQGLWGQLDFSRVSTREDQKALDEPREPIYFLQHAADDVAIGDTIKCVLQCHLSHAAHRCEWGTQLVRSIGRETAQSFERILQTGQGVIEDCRELPELVSGVLDWKSFGQRFRGDLPGLLRHGADGREYTACKEITSRDRETGGEGNTHCEDHCERPQRVLQGGFVNRRGHAIG